MRGAHTEGWSVFDPTAPPSAARRREHPRPFRWRWRSRWRHRLQPARPRRPSAGSGGTDGHAGFNTQVDFVMQGSEPQAVRHPGQGTGKMPGFGEMLTRDMINAIVARTSATASTRRPTLPSATTRPASTTPTTATTTTTGRVTAACVCSTCSPAEGPATRTSGIRRSSASSSCWPRSGCSAVRSTCCWRPTSAPGSGSSSRPRALTGFMVLLATPVVELRQQRHRPAARPLAAVEGRRGPERPGRVEDPGDLRRHREDRQAHPTREAHEPEAGDRRGPSPTSR